MSFQLQISRSGKAFSTGLLVSPLFGEIYSGRFAFAFAGAGGRSSLLSSWLRGAACNFFGIGEERQNSTGDRDCYSDPPPFLN